MMKSLTPYKYAVITVLASMFLEQPSEASIKSSIFKYCSPLFTMLYDTSNSAHSAKPEDRLFYQELRWNAELLLAYRPDPELGSELPMGKSIGFDPSKIWHQRIKQLLLFAQKVGQKEGLYDYEKEALIHITLTDEDSRVQELANAIFEGNGSLNSDIVKKSANELISEAPGLQKDRGFYPAPGRDRESFRRTVERHRLQDAESIIKNLIKADGETQIRREALSMIKREIALNRSR